MKTKAQEYREYIQEHISNVIEVWQELRKTIKTGETMLLKMDLIIEKHDQSKFLKEEFEAYRKQFFPETNEPKGFNSFQNAWNHHQKHNPHHWQYWIMWRPEGSIALDMSIYYIFEMLCDWAAMSLKFNNVVSDWYSKEKDNMLLSPLTQTIVEEWLPKMDLVLETIQKRRKQC